MISYISKTTASDDWNSVRTQRLSSALSMDSSILGKDSNVEPGGSKDFQSSSYAEDGHTYTEGLRVAELEFLAEPPVDTTPPSPFTLRTSNCRKYQRPRRPNQASDTAESYSNKWHYTVLHPSCQRPAKVTIQDSMERTMDDLVAPAAPTDLGAAGQMKKKRDAPSAKTARFRPTQTKTKKETKLEFFGFEDKEDYDSEEGSEGGAAVGGSSSYKIKYFGFDDLSDSDDESSQAKEKKKASLGDILHMVVCKEEDSPEQKRSPSLLQEEPEPPHIKEEQEDETLQRPEEPDGSMLTLLAVKSEVDDVHISSHYFEVEVELESDYAGSDSPEESKQERRCHLNRERMQRLRKNERPSNSPMPNAGADSPEESKQERRRRLNRERMQRLRKNERPSNSPMPNTGADSPEESKRERRRRLNRERMQRLRKNQTDERLAQLRQQDAERHKRRRQQLDDESLAQLRQRNAERKQLRRQQLDAAALFSLI